MRTIELIVIIAIVLVVILVVHKVLRDKKSSQPEHKEKHRDKKKGEKKYHRPAAPTAADLCCAPPIQGSTVTIYLNTDTGLDNRDGQTPGRSVLTFNQAISLLSLQTASTGIINISGTTPLDLGTDTTIDFFPLTNTYGKVIIQGQEENVVYDTVASIVSIGPRSTWNRINGTTGGYGTNTYATRFIHNVTKDRYYVVEDNTTGSVDTIAGPTSFANVQKAWDIGDEFYLFDVPSTITYSGKLVLDIPYGLVVFQSLRIMGAVGSQWNNPIEDNRVQHIACAMDAPSDATGGIASFAGDLLLLGCYVEGTVPNAILATIQVDGAVNSISLWMNGCGVQYTHDSYVYFLKSTNAPAFAIVTQKCQFHGYSMEFTDYGTAAIFFNSETAFVTSSFTCTKTNAGGGYAVASNMCDGHLANFSIIQTPTSGVTIGIYFESLSSVRLSGPIEITATRCLVLDQATWVQTTGATITLTPTGSFAIHVLQQSRISMWNGTTVNCVQTFPFAIIYTLGGEIAIPAGGTWNVSTPAGTPFILLEYGGKGVCRSGIVNSGAGSMVKCGANAAGALVTQNDFAAAGTQLCIFVVV